jgi:hypothetical protein
LYIDIFGVKTRGWAKDFGQVGDQPVEWIERLCVTGTSSEGILSYGGSHDRTAKSREGSFFEFFEVWKFLCKILDF